MRADLTDLLMRALQKCVEQAQFTNRFKSGGMDRVAAEVAQKVSVLLQDEDLDSGPRQQKSQHHSGRATAYDATAELRSLG